MIEENPPAVCKTTHHLSGGRTASDDKVLNRADGGGRFINAYVWRGDVFVFSSLVLLSSAVFAILRRATSCCYRTSRRFFFFLVMGFIGFFFVVKTTLYTCICCVIRLKKTYGNDEIVLPFERRNEFRTVFFVGNRFSNKSVLTN